MDLKKYIRSIPDYPKKGILFRDITTLIKDAKAFKYTNFCFFSFTFNGDSSHKSFLNHEIG